MCAYDLVVIADSREKLLEKLTFGRREERKRFLGSFVQQKITDFSLNFCSLNGFNRILYSIDVT